jgi:glutamyl-tRNA reductase
MYISNIRITFKTAPHDVISRLALVGADKDKLYEALLEQENIDEVVIVQTCNRFEVYYAGKIESEGKTKIRKVFLDWFGASTAKYMVMDNYLDAVVHLFKIASSLDSMVVGESQILAQVKESFLYASMKNYCGKILKLTFQKALSLGKSVRSETGISDGKVSISSLAVDHANKQNPIKDKKVIIVGTGKMASLLADYLPLFKHKELIVIGRTAEKLKEFCKKIPSIPLNFDHLSKELKDADFVFSATSCPNVLITKEMIEKVMIDRTQPLTIIDIAMPEDVDPTVGEVPNVNYYCIDDLQEISKKNMVKRQREAKRAEAIINEEIKRFKNRLQNIHIDHLLYNLNNYTEDIRKREVNKTIKMLGNIKPEAQTVIDGLSKSLTKKVMHNFLLSLKSIPASPEEVERLVNLFTSNGNETKNSKVKVRKSEKISKH